jgi:hypothetical protein
MERRVLQMSNYIDSVYDESFSDTIESFDQYIQESAVLVGGVIAGVLALITMIIVLIKKVFFSKNTASGAADSVVLTLYKINGLLNQNNLPKTITVEKGWPTTRYGASVIRDTVSAINKLFDTCMERELDNNEIKAYLDDLKKGVDKTDEFIKTEFVKRTYNVGDLRGYVKNEINIYKEAANELKALDEKVKKAKKSEKVSSSSKQLMKDYYTTFVSTTNREQKCHKEWYRYIKQGIEQASNSGD